MTYRFSVALPSRLLPSYRGLGSRFLYAVSVAIGHRVHAHIPITILSNGFLGKSQNQGEAKGMLSVWNILYF